MQKRPLPSPPPPILPPKNLTVEDGGEAGRLWASLRPGVPRRHGEDAGKFLCLLVSGSRGGYVFSQKALLWRMVSGMAVSDGRFGLVSLSGMVKMLASFYACWCRAVVPVRGLQGLRVAFSPGSCRQRMYSVGGYKSGRDFCRRVRLGPVEGISLMSLCPRTKNGREGLTFGWTFSKSN